MTRDDKIALLVGTLFSTIYVGLMALAPVVWASANLLVFFVVIYKILKK